MDPQVLTGRSVLWDRQDQRDLQDHKEKLALTVTTERMVLMEQQVLMEHWGQKGL